MFKNNQFLLIFPYTFPKNKIAQEIGKMLLYIEKHLDLGFDLKRKKIKLRGSFVDRICLENQ